MSLPVRHGHRPKADLPPLAAFEVHEVWDADFMARLQDLAIEVIEERFHHGHRAYVAWWNEEPVAFAWVVTRRENSTVPAIRWINAGAKVA